MSGWKETAIHDLVITDLQIIRDDRGSVMHMLRADDPGYSGFGEVYFSTTEPGAIKAWKRHQELTMNVVCLQGRITFAIHDDRPESPSVGQTQTFVLGRDDRYARITVPPMLWTGFMNIGNQEAILANCATQPHRPAEADNRSPDDPDLPNPWII